MDIQFSAEELATIATKAAQLGITPEEYIKKMIKALTALIDLIPTTQFFSYPSNPYPFYPPNNPCPLIPFPNQGPTIVPGPTIIPSITPFQPFQDRMTICSSDEVL